MQSPIMVFDHVKQSVTIVQQGAANDKKVTDVLAAQREQVTSSGSSAAR